MIGTQKHLIYNLARTYNELVKECILDEEFHAFMIKNNDLYPLSLDEMAAEWFAVLESVESD